ncbi:MAG: hypothetical protein U0800_22245 [Isosphaeraceae bacterium]
MAPNLAEIRRQADPSIVAEKPALEAEKLALEVQKLRLEIHDRHNKYPLASQFEKYIPLVTTLIAIIGLCFSVLQYATSRALDRTKDRQQRIRANVEAILKASLEDNLALSNTLYLINELDCLTRGDEEARSQVTNLFYEMIVYDFHDESKLSYARVRFENLVNDNWPEYRSILARESHINERLIERYSRVLAKSRKAEQADSDFQDILVNALNRHGKRVHESPLSDPEKQQLLLAIELAAYGKDAPD